MNGWKNEWMNEWMNEWLNEWMKAFFYSLFPHVTCVTWGGVWGLSRHTARPPWKIRISTKNVNWHGFHMFLLCFLDLGMVFGSVRGARALLLWRAGGAQDRERRGNEATPKDDSRRPRRKPRAPFPNRCKCEINGTSLKTDWKSLKSINGN